MPRSLLSLFPCAEHSAITQPLFAPALSWVWFKADVWWVLCIGKISIELPSHSALKGINENPPQLNIPGSSKEIRVFPKKKIGMSSPPNVPGCANLGLWDGSFGNEKIMKQEMAKWNSDNHFLSRFMIYLALMRLFFLRTSQRIISQVCIN